MHINGSGRQKKREGKEGDRGREPIESERQ
jgi:hypothetical protein